MSLQTWMAPLIVSKLAGAALASSTTSTSIIPPASRILLPAGFFTVGKSISVRAGGKVTHLFPTPGTLTFEMKLGSVVIASSGAFPLCANNLTDNLPWLLKWELTCRAEGATANCMHTGSWLSHSLIGGVEPAAGGATCGEIPYNAAPAVGSNFDSMAAAVLDLFATWSVSSASNTITCETYSVAELN